MSNPVVLNSPTDLQGKRILTGTNLLVYFPETYGAVGDGVTDDKTAIQAAITAALATGGDVFFGAKTYAVSGTVTINQAAGRCIRLYGRGKTLNLQIAGIPGTTIKAITNNFSRVFDFIDLNSVQVDGFYLDCNNKADEGLRITNAVGCYFSNIDVVTAKVAAFHFTNNNAGVYRCTFENLSSYGDCFSGLLLDSQTNPGDVANCNFIRCDFKGTGGNYTVDLKSADGNFFAGCTFTGVNPLGALIFRDPAGVNFGARYNVFVQLDGSGLIQCDSQYQNIAFGFTNANGLDITAGAPHVEKFLIHDVTGFSQHNLISFVDGKAFGAMTAGRSQQYYDTTAALFRFQNWDAATRRGWQFSGAAGVGAEIKALYVDPDGSLFQGALTVAIGRDTVPAHNAANFTATAGTWTVVAGTTLIGYTLLDKTIWLDFNITGSSVSNAGVNLKLTLFGFTSIAARDQSALIYVVDNGAAAAVGRALILAGTTQVLFFSTILGGGFAISAAATQLKGQMKIAIQ